MGVMTGPTRSFVDAFHVLGSERFSDSRLHAGAAGCGRAGLVASAAHCLANQGLQRIRACSNDVSLDAGGGMLEVQMETWSPMVAMSGLQERMVQDVAVLREGDFEDEVLVKRPAAGHSPQAQCRLHRPPLRWRCGGSHGDAALRVCQTFSSPLLIFFGDCSLVGRMLSPRVRAAFLP